MKGESISFFEGTEKKVELVAAPGLPSLRGLGREFWDRLVCRAGARILSRVGNDHCEAYLLSESSLFVFDHKMLMITCGRTRLTEAVGELLEVIPPPQVRFFVYERKNEVFPHTQPTSFFEDIRVLNERLPGRAFQFGDEDDHHLYLYHLDRPYDCNVPDTTVEILMYGLDSAVQELFRAGSGDDTQEVRRNIGISDLLPGFEIDDHLFEPSGYSVNGIRGDEYWTVHVTPASNSSYASFETNHRAGDGIETLARRVLEIFRPRSFDVVLFDQQEETRFSAAGYRLKAHVAQALDCGYRVRFLNFYRPHQGVRRPVELPLA